MFNNDTPDDMNNLRDMKAAGRSPLKINKFGPSMFIIAKLVNYSLALQVINTNNAGNFFLILN